MSQARWLLGMASMLAGCGNVVNTTQLNTPPRPLSPRTPESVEVYASTPPTRPHVDVALLQVEQIDGGLTRTPQLVSKLVQLAAHRGCDALFISGLSERSSGARGSLFDSSGQAVYGTCIAYTTPSSPNAPPPSNAVVLVPEKKPAPSPRATLTFRTGVARR